MDRTTQIILIIFVAVTAVSVLIQAGVILAVFIAARKTHRKIASMTEDFRTHVLPILSSSRETIDAVSPKVKIIVTNLAETTTKLRDQAEHIGAAVGDVVDRTRTQAQRVDGMVGGTLDSITSAVNAVQNGLAAPVRQFNGILNGLRAGIDVMRQKTPNRDHANDDLFI